MRRSHVIGVLAVAVLGIAALVTIPAGAQSPSTLTFKELQKGGTTTFLDNPPKSRTARTPPSAGDEIVFTNPLTKTATNPPGRLHGHCTVTRNGKPQAPLFALCDGAYDFKNGTIYVTTLTNLAGNHTVGAVVGGSGAYAGARGTLESTNGKSASTTTIKLM